MENRVLIEVNNNSDHTFVFDGDWLRSGDWKSDRKQPISARSLTVLEFTSTKVKGVAGIAWWTDDSIEHNVYLSMAFANPRLQRGSFICFAGVPPQDLKAELDAAPRLVIDEVVGNGSCAWRAASLGTRTLIKMTILQDLAHFVPSGATADPHAAACPSACSSPACPKFAKIPTTPEAPSAARSFDFPMRRSTLMTSDKSAVNPGDSKATQDTLGRFLAKTRPKDAMDGLRRGLKTVGTSVAAGVDSVVASTVQGYQQGGFGTLKGLSMGLVSGVAIAIGGTACGVAQIGRGFINTPEAMRGKRDRRVWDKELGKWVDIDLCAMEEKVEAEGSEDEEALQSSVPGFDNRCAVGPLRDGPRREGRDVVDAEYYDLLRIKTTASPSDIKKAYYREARKCHPDKNPDDVEAKAKFQNLADAYQVLSNPALRARYDREGKGDIQDSSRKMDPSVFFGLLFGSERFQPWLGELRLAMQTDEMTTTFEKEAEDWLPEDDAKETELAAGSLKRRQFRREVRCACHLRSKMARFVYGRDAVGFEEQMRQEALDLAEGQFGPELLATLGKIYQLRAKIYLADELIGRLSFTKRVAAMKHKQHTIRHRLHLYQNAADSLLCVKKMHDTVTSNSSSQRAQCNEDAPGSRAAEEKNPKDTGQHKAVEDALDDALPVFLQTAWAAAVTDIDQTIKQVGRKLLKDKSVPWQIRVRRAQALQLLGQVFLEEGAKAVAEQGNTTSRMMNSGAAKATLQEALLGSVREKR